MADNIKLNVAIGLIEHKFISFELSEYAKGNKAPIDSDKYEFMFEFTLQVLEAEKQIRVDFVSKLFLKEEGLNVELAVLNLLCLFRLVNFDEIIKRDSENRLLTPNVVIQTCNTIALGSARGMFTMALANTPYSNAVLPLVNPNTLIPKEN
ncbi:MAG: hypothetical protein JNK91_14880 [Ferruginibacter sp.]|nr:hypothetical protein [Ferruginibacter sp.]